MRTVHSRWEVVPVSRRWSRRKKGFVLPDRERPFVILIAGNVVSRLLHQDLEDEAIRLFQWLVGSSIDGV
jgi:hypothetical protein